MKFSKADPNENFPMMRFVSEGGKWELGFCPMAFGVRVRMGETKQPCCLLDYCAGADRDLQMHVLILVLLVLERFDEEVTPKELRRYFPYQYVKPMDLDRICYKRLIELSDSDVPLKPTVHSPPYRLGRDREILFEPGCVP